MLKNRIAVVILLLAISSSLVACKSDNDENVEVEETQASSGEIQGDVLSAGGNFTKLLVSIDNDTLGENEIGSSDPENQENSSSSEGTSEAVNTEQTNTPQVGLAVRDSKDMIDIEESKIIGSIEYDTIDISSFNDCGEVELVDDITNLTASMQVMLSKFEMEKWSTIIGYMADVCNRFHIDISTVESARGLKTDTDIAYKIIVASNDKYNIYLAINKNDYTAKYSVKEK